MSGETSDLQEFLQTIERYKDLRQISGASQELEIGVLTEIVNEREGPALLFDHIPSTDQSFRLLTNFLTTARQVALLFGLPYDSSALDIARFIKDKLKVVESLPPKLVSTGPVSEVEVDGARMNLEAVPAPKWHEQDGGRYLGTGCVVLTRDLQAGWVNAGTYRIQLHGPDLLGIYVSPGHHASIMRSQWWASGKPCPVVVVIGCHPFIWFSSFISLPWGQEELAYAGGLSGEAFPIIRGDLTGLPIPAQAEFAIEGEIPPPEKQSHAEGPFGETTGYYASGERIEAIIKVKKILHRKSPILLGAPPLRPPGASVAAYLLRSANVWRELESLGIPGIAGVWHLRPGGSRYFTVVSISQKYAGHAKQVGTAAMSGSEGAYHGRFVIVVDDDIDPTSTDEVLWAVATRCDPEKDIDIIRGCWSTPLDPTLSPRKRADKQFTNSRAIIDACKPYHWKDRFPRSIQTRQELKDQVWSKWSHCL